MEFRIRISAGNRFAIEFGEENLGIVCLEWLRDQIGVSVPHECVDKHIPGYRAEVQWMAISETRARQSGMFRCATDVYVEVPPEFLNRYVRKNVVMEKDTTSGEIVYAAVKRRIDIDAVLHGWEKAGYPLKWGFDKEEINQ